MTDKTKDLGVNVNLSIVGNDTDGYNGGVHITTSDGMDISAETNGDSLNSFIDSLTMSLMQNVLTAERNKQAKLEKERVEKAQKMYEEKRIKLDALYDHVDQLEEEISKLESELYSATELTTSTPIVDKHPTLDDLFGSDKDDFFDYLDSLLK